MKMDEHEIVKLLNIIIGRTEASGESHKDKDILENLSILVEVTDTLLGWLHLSSETYDSYEGSCRVIGEVARGALIEFGDMINGWLEE